jgi:hypothetical protein
MADLVIVAANVVAGANASTRQSLAGETITAGQAIYLAAATGKWMKADADAAPAEGRHATHIALNGAALDQPLVGQKSGDITLGAVLTPGVAYYLSGATAGGICAFADIGVGEYVCLLGLAKSASVLALNIQFPGVVN